MQYFKNRSAKPIKPPVAHRVLVFQVMVTVVIGLAGALYQPIAGLSLLMGGLVSFLGQAYFNSRALRSFGDRNTANVLAATYSAMWGKWLIIIGLALVLIMRFDSLNAGLLFAGLFVVHTLGALAIPILVRRVAN